MDAPYAGVLGGYRLFGPIAVDGAGQVFAAEPPGGGRVLVRVLAAAPASFAEFDARARALEQLVHPGLVPVLAHGAEGGRAWIATAQTEADPLRAPRLPDHQVLALAAGLADALDYAHAHGQVHGDLGPGAVLLSRIHAPGTPGSVVITGLGVLGLTGRLTPNPLAGGPDCCAPEVLAASAATPAADQYALACLLYRLLTGTPVFPGGSHQQVADGHLQQSPAPISSRRPEPAGLDPVFARALAKDPEQRHPSCRVFVDALAAVLAPPPAAPPGPSNPTLVPSPAPSSPGAEAATAPAGQDAPSRPDPGAPAAGGNGSGDGGPDSPTDGAPRRRRKLALIGALVVLVLAIAGTVVGILATGGDEPLDQTTASTLSTDGSTTCAVRDGQAYCWGANESGQVGDGTTEQRTTPVKVPGLGTVSSIVVGGGTVCAIADEQLYCWGANESGKVGDGTTEPVGKPARVGDLQR
ncbi:protein kinase domain-containing protein, partial [Gordonia sp. VNK21]|uniref:protein kinase domain-containing protein n=1 Tax=Gordonia sp. VNK21 TaxID=3382483 RepID=UPI0038D3952A